MFEALHAYPAHQIFVKCFLFHEHVTWQVTKIVHCASICMLALGVPWGIMVNKSNFCPRGCRFHPHPLPVKTVIQCFVASDSCNYNMMGRTITTGGKKFLRKEVSKPYLNMTWGEHFYIFVSIGVSLRSNHGMSCYPLLKWHLALQLQLKTFIVLVIRQAYLTGLF